MNNPTAIPPLVYGTAMYSASQSIVSKTSRIIIKDEPIYDQDGTNKLYVETHGGGGVTPGLPAKSVQFNSNPPGLLEGSSNFLFNNLTNTLELNGNISLTNVNSKISGLALPTSGTDAANKNYVDSVTTPPSLPFDSIQYNNAGSFAGSADLKFNNLTSTLELNGDILLTNVNSKISGLALPTGGTDAANKNYVDSISTPPSLPLNSIQYNNGGSFAGSSNLTFNVTTLSVASIIDCTNSTDSTNISTGAIKVAGGLGVTKNVHIGGTCYADDFLTTSDVNLKSDIQLVDDNLVRKILSIESYSYKLKNDKKFGFIAQELEEIGLNDFVKDVDGTKKVNYQFFIPLIISILKNQQQRIEELEKFI